MAAAVADYDGDTYTPLHRAAMCTQPEGAAADGVRLLLAAGADATAKNKYGYTALHIAAEIGPDDPSLAGMLMGAGCDPAAKGSTGYTALTHAKRYNKPRMAALLQAAGEHSFATLAPYRAEVAALTRRWRADHAMPEGTRICVAGRGRASLCIIPGAILPLRETGS